MPLTDRQSAIPLLEALQTAAHAPHAAFHTPGHKKGQGMPAPLIHLWGAAVFQADLPELPELDNLFAPTSVIQAAQDLAAEAFGADRTWFLANGSTCGIEAAVLATCNPGDKIILPRNVHQSAIAALILSGAIPIWVAPEYDAAWNLVHGVSPASLERAIGQHPDAKAVLIVSPTYYGVCSHVEAIASLTHQHNMPLLVDEAHGAHFAFHPHLPTPALQAGADLVVQSTHKTLSALTQAAMLHLQGDRVDGDRLTRCLQLVQSTSPSYLLLASLDAARQQMATQGKALWTKTLRLAAIAQTQLSQIPGLAVLPAAGSPGFYALDPTRITVDVSGLGLTGFAADERLHQTLNVTCELPGLQHLTFILTPGNTPEDIDRLIQSFKILAATPSCSPPTFSPTLPPLHPPTPSPPHPLTPRQAFFSPTHTVPIETAIAHLSAELICPYPPGIPVLFPGERITVAAIEYLQKILATGGILTGCTDPQLHTLKIVKE